MDHIYSFDSFGKFNLKTKKETSLFLKFDDQNEIIGYEIGDVSVTEDSHNYMFGAQYA